MTSAIASGERYRVEIMRAAHRDRGQAGLARATLQANGMAGETAKFLCRNIVEVKAGRAWARELCISERPGYDSHVISKIE
jgi:hypothetical protein